MPGGQWTRRGALALLASGMYAPGTAARRPGRLLFVGNSFTLGHDVPSMVGGLFEDNGVPVATAMLARNGAMLADHVREERLFRLMDMIQPDVLVLQDHSKAPLTDEGRAISMAAINAIARRTNAVITLVATWPRRTGHMLYSQQGMPADPVHMAEITNTHYHTVARSLGARVAPVGRAWIAAANAGLRLYGDDGYHAAPSGAWLAASVIVRTLGVDGDYFLRHPDGVPKALALYLRRLSQPFGS